MAMIPVRAEILPGIFRDRMLLNRAYLAELDSTCLLQNYYLEAGITLPGMQAVPDPAKAKLHWGWEAPSCQLRGHFLGHWLSAAAALTASEGDAELKAKADKIVHEIKKCQDLNGGEWTGPIPEKYFDIMLRGNYIWSPQYTMHKVVMGLTDMLRLTGNEEAGEILFRLADWYLKWIGRVRDIRPGAIFEGEQAGMLEVWAALWELTRCEKYKDLAEAYAANPFFAALDRGEDPLTSNHANASIPLAQGALKMARVTGDSVWIARAEKFWHWAVTARGAYATGGANAGEFWIPPMRPGATLGRTNQEFCTVYNMVRVADGLLAATGRTEYADYIERALYNGYLAQQNRSTGMPAYFLPLSAGSRKEWGSRRHDFWCCHGTMVQAQTQYPDLVAKADQASRRIMICQYIPSLVRVPLEGGAVSVRQSVAMRGGSTQVLFTEHGDGRSSRWNIRFEVDAENGPCEIRLRLPSWAEGYALEAEGGPLPHSKEGGWIVLRCEGRTAFTLNLACGVRFEALPDREDLSAAMEGPIVLAGLTDRDEGLREGLIRRTEHTYGVFDWLQSHYETRQEKNFSLLPLYEVTDEVYTVYFTRMPEKGK